MTTQQPKVAKAASKPPKTPKVNDFLNPKKVGHQVSSNRKEKPISHFPIKLRDGEKFSLAEKMDSFAAGKGVMDAAQRKIAELKLELKSFLLEDFAKRWADKGGSPPKTRIWKAFRSNLDHCVTSYINFDRKKQEAIEEEFNIKMANNFEVSGFKIDMDTLKSNPEYYDAFKKFLGVFKKEDREVFVERKYRLKKEFFNNLANICGQNPKKLHRMLQILDPRVSFLNIESSDKEEDLFDFVKGLQG